MWSTVCNLVSLKAKGKKDMNAMKDGTLLAYIESFYVSEDDHQRALYGALIIGYLEAVFGMYIRKSEDKPAERKEE